MIRQRVHVRELVVDAGGERERIETVALAHEGGHLRGVGLGTHADAVQRGLRRVVVPAESRADAFFALEFHRRQEEILQQPQVGIHGVHRRERGSGVIPHIPHQFADMRPVLLLDVRVVVLLVRSPARELDLVGPAVLMQVRVDEFRAVVGVDATERERQGRAPLGEAFLHAHLAFPQDGAVFDPRGVDVSQIQRMEEVPVGAVARVAHQVHLGEAGLGDVPVIGLDRNVVLQQRPGLVRPYMRRRIVRLSGANRRSIWRALMARTFVSVAGTNARRRRAHGSQVGSRAFRRWDHG